MSASPMEKLTTENNESPEQENELLNFGHSRRYKKIQKAERVKDLEIAPVSLGNSPAQQLDRYILSVPTNSTTKADLQLKRSS